MWHGTLRYTKGRGSISELLDAGVCILDSKKIRHGGITIGIQLTVRFSEESKSEIKALDNVYIWTGRWVRSNDYILEKTT